MSQGRGPCHYSLRRGGEVVEKKKQLSFPGCPSCCDIMLKLCLCLECGGRVHLCVFVFVYVCLCIGMCSGFVGGGGYTPH